MKNMSRKMTMPSGSILGAKVDQHNTIMRRSTNRNAHIITPHGKVMAGRKGRKG